MAAVLLAYAVVGRRLRSTPISGAIVFTAVGLLASDQGTGLISPSGHGHVAAAFLELTLVIVLFTDAMAVSGARWTTEAPLTTRLLGLGLPLTMVAGWVLALLPDAELWEAALLAAVLAPTDSALGLVEGGLNDGLALPLATIFLALALKEKGAVGGGHLAEVFLRALVASGAIGVVVGRAARCCCAGRWAGLVGTALAVGGVAGHGRPRLRARRRHRGQRLHRRLGGRAGRRPGLAGQPGRSPADPRRAGQPGDLGQLRAVRALFLAPALTEASWVAVAYALGSLTVVRMAPVAAALLASRLARPTVAYIGWFGPRGLASIVFADLVATSGLPEQGLIVTVVMLTVGLSVVLHGVTAPWGAQRYGNWFAAAVTHDPGTREAAEPPEVAHQAKSTRWG